ncbi:MAG: hypothetical protein DHS20C02_04720 [Micavibrio sp.]|nr:MAG: hypothetical protein DHS20C02_04720 [Micavibrio sp.]
MIKARLHERWIIAILICGAFVLALPLTARALDSLYEKPLFEEETLFEKGGFEEEGALDQGSRDEMEEDVVVEEVQEDIQEPIAVEQEEESKTEIHEVIIYPDPKQINPAAPAPTPAPVDVDESMAPEENSFEDSPKESSEEPSEESRGLGDVLRRAYLTNPTLLAARQELKATHELLPQAMAGWKPTVSADAGITNTDVDGSNFGTATGSTSKDVGLSLDQPLFRGGRTVSEMAAARSTIAAQAASLSGVEQSVLREAATAYMDVVRDQALFDLSWNNREVIARQLEATQDRFEVGELTRTDVSQAEARLARADADAITARGSLRTVQAVFEQVIGIPAGKLGEPSVMLDIPKTLDEAAALAEQANPQVMAATHAHKASEDDVNDVFGELLPTVGLSGSWNRSYDPSPGLIDEQTSRSVGVTASIPLYQAGSVRSRVRQAKQTANQRYIQILETRREARQQAISDWETLQAAQAEIRSRTAQVEASKIAQEGVEAETEVGQRTILDALDANQEFLDAQAALVSARRNEIVASFSLAATLGLLTPERLGFPGDTIGHSAHLDDVKHKIFNMDVDRVGRAD